MSNRQHTRPTTGAASSKEMVRAGGKAGRPPAVPGTCEVMGDQPRTYRGESMLVKACWKVRDDWESFGPWVTTGGLFSTGAATFLAHEAGHLSLGHVGAAGLTATIAAYVAAQRKLRGDEHENERWWVRIGATASAGWLALATQIGPANPVALWSLIAGATACGWKWYRYHNGKVQQVEAQPVPAPEIEAPAAAPVAPVPVERDPAELLLEYWQEQWIAVTNQLANCKGSRVTSAVEPKPGHVMLTVKIVPVKQNQDSIVNAAKNVETGLKTQDGKHLRPGALKVVADKTDSTLVSVHIQQINPLAEIITYASLRPHMPRTINEPLLMGKRQDGSRDRQMLLGSHWLIGADTGGGKSNLMHTIMANLAPIGDAVIWGADMKGCRALGPWLPRIDWLATTLDEVDLQLRSLEAILDYRMTLDITEDQITPRPDLPAIVYILDEGAEVTGSRAERGMEFAKRLERISSLGRALAISVVYATQYCSLESLQSAIFRAQLTTRFLLRTDAKLTASFVLGEDAWGNIKIGELEIPGMYFKRAGTTQPLSARTPLMTPDKSNALCMRLAWEGAENAPALDSGSAAVAVPEYAWRRTRLPDHLARAFLTKPSQAALAGGSSYVQAPIPGTDVTGGTRGVPGADEGRPKGGYPAVPEGGSPGVPEGGSRPVPEGGYSGGTRGVPDPAVKEVYDRIWGPISQGGNVVPIDSAAARRAAAGVDMDAVFGEAKGALARVLVTCHEDGVTRKEIREATGMGHDWVSVRCNRLAERGVCFAPRGIQGRYRAIPGVSEANILAALDAIEGELKEARRRAREAAGAQS